MHFKYRLAISLLNIISNTWRIRISGENHQSQKSVVAFWHGEMLPIWKYFQNKESAALISKSKDGDILSHLLQKWNFTLVRGSSSNKGTELLSDMVELAKTHNFLITPDGPSGPIYSMKPGAVITAQRSGVELYLAKAQIKSKFVFKKSWDNFILPLPFAKVRIKLHNFGIIDKNIEKVKINDIISEVENILKKM